MSVVVALKHNGVVYLGSDSQATCGDVRVTLTNPNNFKMWKVEDTENCIMASVGNMVESQFIKVYPPELDELSVIKDEIDYKYVVKYIVPHIREVLVSTKCMKDDADHWTNSFLFCYRDKIYNIDACGTVLEIDDFTAIGSGMCEALGSLEATRNSKQPEVRLAQAVIAACKSNNYVNYPIILTNTKTCGFKMVDKD